MVNVEDMMTLEESGVLPTSELEENTIQEETEKKVQKRKTGWGPVLRVPRPRRGPEDGKTVMQRAQELKKEKNLEKGNNYSASFAFKSNCSLNNSALSVGIELGSDNLSMNETIDGLKQKELENLRIFKENNPEVNLPANLVIEVVAEDFPPLAKSVSSPMKEIKECSSQSWVQVVSKDNGMFNLDKISNDRCILECERP
jgi:hypothetical protein